VGARLELVELGAGATGAHELLVRAGLDHAPVLERDVAERAASHRTAIALVPAGAGVHRIPSGGRGRGGRDRRTARSTRSDTGRSEHFGPHPCRLTPDRSAGE
jgi:hypothetical protein